VKQKDIALIVVIVIVSAIISFFLSNSVIGSSKNKLQASVVQPITSGLTAPDSHYFNSNAFDPAQTINISPNNNTNPFNGSSQ